MRKIRKRTDEEFLQMQFTHWLDAKDLLYTASMAGVNLNIAVAVKRKRMGCKAGTPDIMIFEPHGRYFGLFIELKSYEGRSTPDQEEWRKQLNRRGYLAFIMPSGYDFQDGFNYLRNLVEQYIRGQL